MHYDEQGPGMHHNSSGSAPLQPQATACRLYSLQTVQLADCTACRLCSLQTVQLADCTACRLYGLQTVRLADCTACRPLRLAIVRIYMGLFWPFRILSQAAWRVPAPCTADGLPINPLPTSVIIALCCRGRFVGA